MEKKTKAQKKRESVEELCKRLGIPHKNTTKEHLGESVIIPTSHKSDPRKKSEE